VQHTDLSARFAAIGVAVVGEVAVAPGVGMEARGATGPFLRSSAAAAARGGGAQSSTSLLAASQGARPSGHLRAPSVAGWLQARPGTAEQIGSARAEGTPGASDGGPGGAGSAAPLLMAQPIRRQQRTDHGCGPRGVSPPALRAKPSDGRAAAAVAVQAAAAPPPGGGTSAFLATTRHQAALAGRSRVGQGGGDASPHGGCPTGGPGCYKALSYVQVDAAIRFGVAMRPQSPPAADSASARQQKAAAVAAAAAACVAARRAAARAARAAAAVGSSGSGGGGGGPEGGGGGMGSALRQTLETPRDAAAAPSSTAGTSLPTSLTGAGCTAGHGNLHPTAVFGPHPGAAARPARRRSSCISSGSGSRSGISSGSGSRSGRAPGAAGGSGGVPIGDWCTCSGGSPAWCGDLTLLEPTPSEAGCPVAWQQGGGDAPLDLAKWGCWGFAGMALGANASSSGCGQQQGPRAGRAFPAAGSRGAIPQRRANTAPAPAQRQHGLLSAGAAAGFRVGSVASARRKATAAAAAAAAASSSAAAQRGAAAKGCPRPWTSGAVRRFASCSGGGGSNEDGEGDQAPAAEEDLGAPGACWLSSGGARPGSAVALAVARQRWAGNLLREQDGAALTGAPDVTPAGTPPSGCGAGAQDVAQAKRTAARGVPTTELHHQPQQCRCRGQPFSSSAAAAEEPPPSLQAVSMAAVAAAACRRDRGWRAGCQRCTSAPAGARRGPACARPSSAGGSGSRDLPSAVAGTHSQRLNPEAQQHPEQQRQRQQTQEHDSRDSGGVWPKQQCAPAQQRRPATSSTLCPVPSGAPLLFSPCHCRPGALGLRLRPASAGALAQSAGRSGRRPGTGFDSLTRAEAARGLRAMGARGVVPPAPDVETPRGHHLEGGGGGGAWRNADPSVLGHVRRAPAVRLPPNSAALSRKWARAAARAAMEAL
jgi:hypothetical protein